MAWSVEHGDVVVSKVGAARWGPAARPRWAMPLAAAARAYTGRQEPGDAPVLAEGRAVILAAAEAALAAAG